MASGENTLWIVTKMPKFHTVENIISEYVVQNAWVFRTRTAARNFAIKKELASKLYDYSVKRATWGPEQ